MLWSRAVICVSMSTLCCWSGMLCVCIQSVQVYMWICVCTWLPSWGVGWGGESAEWDLPDSKHEGTCMRKWYQQSHAHISLLPQSSLRLCKISISKWLWTALSSNFTLIERQPIYVCVTSLNFITKRLFAFLLSPAHISLHIYSNMCALKASSYLRAIIRFCLHVTNPTKIDTE